MIVTPVREATDHRPKEVDRQQRMIGTQTEHMEEVQYREVVKKVGALARDDWKYILSVVHIW